jgi:hypothetical protein
MPSQIFLERFDDPDAAVALSLVLVVVAVLVIAPTSSRAVGLR